MVQIFLLLLIASFQAGKNVVRQPRAQCTDSEPGQNVKREMHSQIDPRQTDPYYIYEQYYLQNESVRPYPESGGDQHGKSRMATWKTVGRIGNFPGMNDI